MLSDFWTFWSTNGPDIRNGAVVLSAVAAFLVIGAARRNACRRNTLDLILHQQSDRELIEARQAFNKLKAGNTKLATFASLNQRGTDEFEAIKTVLNVHELTAVSISEGVLDERVYRSWFDSTMTSDYEATSAFIATARKTYDTPKGWCEFENLAKRWSEVARVESWWTRKRKALRHLKSA